MFTQRNTLSNSQNTIQFMHSLTSKSLAIFVSATLTFYPVAGSALPQGGQVVEGSASIGSRGNFMQINQRSGKAIINWDSYNIGDREWVNYRQPSRGSVALNRITGQDPSSILGRLTANGQIMLVNPNGVFFGSSARVDVSGLVATTADISNENFMAGRYIFDQKSDVLNAGVTNNGRIRVHNSGIAAFVSPFVRNNGSISAVGGKVALAGTDVFTLDLYGDNLVKFAIDDEVGNQVDVTNNGGIFAGNGRVEISAGAARRLVDSAINLDGLVSAQTVLNDGGTISIRSAGDINIAETNRIDASAALAGDGGDVTILADGTTHFKGQVSANAGYFAGDGGFVEVSGGDMTLDGKVHTSARKGTAGHIVFDPRTMIVDAAAAATIENSLANSSVVDVAATHRIDVEAEINTTAQTNTSTLNFMDQDADSSLTVRLYEKILLGGNQTLTGDATLVQMLDTDTLLNNAVDIAADGARVQMIAGQFSTPEQVVIDKALSLRGAGLGQTVLNSGFTTAMDDTSDRGLVLVTGAGSLDMRNLSLAGSDVNAVDTLIVDEGTGPNRYQNIGFSNANTGLSNVGGDVRVISSVFNMVGGALESTGATGFVASNNTMTGTSNGTAITVTGAAGAEVTGNTISQFDDGVDIQNSANASVRNNQISNLQGFGVRLQNSNGATASNNTLVSVKKNGFIVNGSQNARIQNNTMDGSKRSAVNAFNGNNAGTVISGNTFTGTYNNQGIKAKGVAEIRGNTVSGSKQAAIRAHAVGEVANNNVSGSKTGIAVTGNSAGHTVTGNTISGNETGMRIDDNAAGLITKNNIFTANTGQHVVNTSNHELNMRNNTFDGVKTVDMTLAELFALEDMITHKMDDNSVGRVLFGAKNSLYVTTNTLGVQHGLDLVDENGNVFVNDGTYTLASTLNMNTKGVTLSGLSRDGVILDGSGIASGYGLLVDANGTTLENFTLNGPTAGTYGIKIQPDTLDSNDTIRGVTVQNVAVRGSGRSEIDVNGGRNITIDNVLLDGQNTAGVGLAITDSRGVNVSNITTLNNNWGGVGLFAAGNFYRGGVRDVQITGTNSFGELNPLYGTESNGATVENVYLPDFSHIVNNMLASGSFFAQLSEQEAVDFALSNPYADLSVVRTLAHDAGVMETTPEENYIVAFNTADTAHLNLQTAIDYANYGATINMREGDFSHFSPIVVRNGVTILGAGEGLTSLNASMGLLRKLDSFEQGFYGPIMHVVSSDVTLRDFTINGENGEGLLVGNNFKPFPRQIVFAVPQGMDNGIIDGPRPPFGFGYGVSNFLAESITVQGSAGNEIALRGVNGGMLRNVTTNGLDTDGAGVDIASSRNILIDGLVTDGTNSDGGIAVRAGSPIFDGPMQPGLPAIAFLDEEQGLDDGFDIPRKRPVGGQTDNITVLNADGVKEFNPLAFYNTPFSEVTNFYVPDFNFAAKNEAHVPGGIFFQRTEADGIAMALSAQGNEEFSTLQSVLHNHVEDFSQLNDLDFYVGNGMSVDRAVNAVLAGGDVTVRAGTYGEDININRSLNLRGDGANVVTLNGETTVDATDVLISGFTFAGNGEGTAVNLTDESGNVTLNNNVFSNWRTAIAVERALNTIISNNAFTSNGTALLVNDSDVANPSLILTDNAFALDNSFYVRLFEDMVIEAGQNEFGGVLPENMTLAELGNAEIKISHGPDGAPFDGLVRLVDQERLIELIEQDINRLIGNPNFAALLSSLGGDVDISALIQPAAGEEAGEALGFSVLALVQYFINTGYVVDEDEAVRVLLQLLADGAIPDDVLASVQ